MSSTFLGKIHYHLLHVLFAGINKLQRVAKESRKCAAKRACFPNLLLAVWNVVFPFREQFVDIRCRLWL